MLRLPGHNLLNLWMLIIEIEVRISRIPLMLMQPTPHTLKISTFLRPRPIIPPMLNIIVQKRNQLNLGFAQDVLPEDVDAVADMLLKIVLWQSPGFPVYISVVLVVVVCCLAKDVKTVEFVHDFDGGWVTSVGNCAGWVFWVGGRDDGVFGWGEIEIRGVFFGDEDWFCWVEG